MELERGIQRRDIGNVAMSLQELRLQKLPVPEAEAAMTLSPDWTTRSAIRLLAPDSNRCNVGDCQQPSDLADSHEARQHRSAAR